MRRVRPRYHTSESTARLLPVAGPFPFGPPPQRTAPRHLASTELELTGPAGRAWTRVTADALIAASANGKAGSGPRA